MTNDDYEDLIGSVPARAPVAPKRKPGRPPKADKPYEGPAGTDAMVTQALMRPVTIGFLSNVMKMDRQTVTKRLAPLPPVGTHRGNTPVYDFRQAMSYLAAPVISPEEIIKRISSTDLPASLQKDVWDARLKMQKWKAQAGELWPTEAVLEVLGEAFQRLKTTTQLWIDQITESQALTPAIREELTVLVDALMADMHRSLVQMAQERATRSQLAEIEGTDLDG